ncbi:Cytochrome P450 714C2 [Vitis vinifera]|uniref:Cytochrome P450 714C2 n=1 Tax=Vitis vinifera TaxID=29760 RepID=A0A438KP36_VITVI|nr:Cytochrome P450 714C2 [Vitis vinifera]
MEVLGMVFRLLISVAVVSVLGLLVRLYQVLMLKPERLRSKLRKQGIRGPAPTILLGNIREIKKKAVSTARASEGAPSLSHNCDLVFPFLPDLVREITTCTSLDLEKPSYQHKERGPSLGQGILTSNGAIWAYHRKILAPELYMDKVKKSRIDTEGGLADIKIDEYMRSFSGDVISRACFGSNYSKGEQIFLRLRALQEAVQERHLPTKSNREAQRVRFPYYKSKNSTLKITIGHRRIVPLWNTFSKIQAKRTSFDCPNGGSSSSDKNNLHSPAKFDTIGGEREGRNSLTPRVCLGQNLVMVELKILLALVLSNFSFSLSPKYRHCLPLDWSWNLEMECISW